MLALKYEFRVCLRNENGEIEEDKVTEAFECRAVVLSYPIGSRNTLRCLGKGVRSQTYIFLSAHPYSSMKDRFKGDRRESGGTLSFRYRQWWMKVLFKVFFKVFNILFNPYKYLLAKFSYLYFIGRKLRLKLVK